MKARTGSALGRLVVSVGMVAALGYGAWSFLHRRAESRRLEAVPVAEVSPAVVNLQDSFASVSAAVKPAVVNISTVQIIKQKSAPYEFYFGDPFQEFFEEFFGRRAQPRARPRTQERRAEGTGSGVIIESDGMVLTNEHVVRGANTISVTRVDAEGRERKYEGTVVGTDPRTDMAVVRIKSKEPLPVARLGDSDHIRVGDWVIAIGSPFGLEQTVTVGIISAKRQSLNIEGREYRDLVQTDAAINRGNSGGPLLNIRGEVIGINTAIYAPTGVFAGIGFAIPVNKAKEVLNDLIHKGKVVRGWLGIEIKTADEAIAKQFGLPDVGGALVNHVLKGSPAEQAGLKRGDVIRKVNGQPVKTVADLQGVVGKSSPKARVVLEVIRARKPQVITVTLAEMPANPEEAMESGGKGGVEGPVSKPWLGMAVKTFTPAMAEEYGLPEEEKGVVIVELEPGSRAAEAGLAVGDCIRSVNQNPTPGVAEFERVTRTVRLADGVVLDVNRQGRAIYMTLMGE